MRALLDELLGNLRAFLDQSDQVLMVVEVNDASNGLVVRAVSDIDQNDPHLFWTFADDFVHAEGFVRSIAQRVYERRELACQMLAKSNEPLWPPLPKEAFDFTLPPMIRMHAIMCYARSLSPSLREMHLVWGLFPSTTFDPGAYRTFVFDLMAHEFPAAWCHHMRVLVRDDTARPALRDVGTIMRGARWYAPRLGPEDIERAVEEQASNETLPVEQRVQALLTLAGLDYAHQRFAESLEKYKIAGDFYSATGRHALYALTLNGMGEVWARAGQPDRARTHFEAALTPALARLGQADDPSRIDAAPVLLNISLNLGNLYLEQRRWSEAGGYYEAAKGVAHGLANVEIKMLCIENIGSCHYELGQHVEAIKAWEEGVVLARSLEAEQPLRNFLFRQRTAFDKLGLHDRRDAVDLELQRLDAAVRRGQS